jgi:histidinol-phosphate phosphatase family protein
MVDKYYLSDPAGVELIEGSVEALRRAEKMGFMLFVVSNQSGIARGITSEERVKLVNARLMELLIDEGINLHGLYYCPHHPDYTECCDCRKPGRGMIDRALESYDLDLAASYVIGDSKVDVDLARRVGATGILVATGYGREQIKLFGKGEQPDYFARDILDGVRWIAKRDRL